MVAYPITVSEKNIRFACPRHPLRSPLALAIEEAMPGRMEAVCVEVIYLKPDTEIKLPTDARLREHTFDRSGICLPYTTILELPDDFYESLKQDGVQLALPVAGDHPAGTVETASPAA